MKNVSYAFVELLKKIKYEGKLVKPRGFLSKEILSQKIVIEYPSERCVVIPYRFNNIFATVAETFWVIAGRNDLDFLSYYLPRAINFSDNGKTWRAAYGPRIRNWRGRVDQVKEVFRVLKNKDSKRAVISIFDPELDYDQTSKDIPCNNWIQFLSRDRKLHMNVTLRANDLFWGFSGINTFEWSVLLELMTYWLRLEKGTLTFFVGSLHYYERHFQQVDNILASFQKTIYDFGIKNIPIMLDIEDLDIELSKWFYLEKEIRSGKEPFGEISELRDQFFQETLKMMIIYYKYKMRSDIGSLCTVINMMRESDLRVSSIEYLVRNLRIPLIRDLELSEKEKEFFSLLF